MPIEEKFPGALRRIVTSQQDTEQLATGFGGQQGPAEGPLWWREGGYLLFSDIHNSRIMKWTPGQGISVEQEGTDRSNGLTRDPQGRLVSCHHFTRRVTRRELDGSITVVASSYRGMKLNRPNDVVVKSDGSIYFSDPFPRPPLSPPDHTTELDLAGVFRVSPDLSTINLIVRDFVAPNGLAFSPDEKVLYLIDRRRLIKAFDVQSNGLLDWSSERVFCELVGDVPGIPDGMKVDIEGNVYCTGPRGIWVISPEGQHLGTILFEAQNTAYLRQAINMAWGDEDWMTLYFTSWDSLNKIRLGIPGIPVPSLPAS